MKSNATRIIAVANEKGGVGKTATVVNLGAAMNEKGLKVLIVDMDPQHNATTGLGVTIADDATHVYHLITDNETAAGNAVVRTKWENLHLIPSHSDLAGAEIELIDMDGRENRLKEALLPLAETYDVILLDTPPSLSLLTVNVFAFAREVVIPCQTQPYAYGALQELFDTIGAIQDDINPDLMVTGIVATFFDKRTRVSHTILDKLRNTPPYKELLFNTAVRNNITIAASSDIGKPIIHYRKGSYGTADYRALAEEVLERLPQ